MKADYTWFWFDVPGNLFLGKFDMEDVNMALNYFLLIMFAFVFRIIAHFYAKIFINSKK